MDVSKVVSCVVSQAAKVKSYLMVAAIVGMSALCGSSAFAQSTTIPVDVPDLDYAGVGTALLAAVIPGLVAAIALGLSIWGLAFIYRKFKGMGK